MNTFRQRCSRMAAHERLRSRVLFFLSFVLLMRFSVQHFTCPLACQCQELILTTDCSNTYTIPSSNFYNISSYSTVVLLSQNELDNVTDILQWDTLGNVRKLSLASNRIESFEVGTIGRMRGLLYLDLSNNSLYRVPSEIRSLTRIKYLDLSDNFITFIEADDFANFKDLRTLQIMNSLTSIARGAFSSFSKIDSLNLSGSDFSMITTCLDLEAWFGYSNESSTLKEINLSYASLCLSNYTFYGFSNLRTVNISFNNIPVLPIMLIRGLRNLQILDLRANYISKIPVNFFANSKALKFLDIAINNLTSIGNNSLESLRRLRVLNLEGNYISGAAPLDFNKLRNLQELNLRKNNIREFPLVNSLHKLESLDLSKNSIEEVTTNALSDCRKLKTVKLNRNIGLRKLELDTTNLNNMENISIKHNSIYCDCNLLRYHEYLMNKYERLPYWLDELFQTERCKMRKFEGQNWYGAAMFLSSYMICSHHTPPIAIAVLVGSWCAVVLGAAGYVWLRSMCSAKRQRELEASRARYTRRRTRRRTRKPRASQDVAAEETTEPQPIWEEKGKLLPEEKSGSNIRLSEAKWKSMTESFV